MGAGKATGARASRRLGPYMCYNQDCDSHQQARLEVVHILLTNAQIVTVAFGVYLHMLPLREKFCVGGKPSKA